MNNTAGALLGALALVAVTLGGGGLAWGGAERAAPAVIASVVAIALYRRAADPLG